MSLAYTKQVSQNTTVMSLVNEVVINCPIAGKGKVPLEGIRPIEVFSMSYMRCIPVAGPWADVEQCAALS